MLLYTCWTRFSFQGPEVLCASSSKRFLLRFVLNYLQAICFICRYSLVKGLERAWKSKHPLPCSCGYHKQVQEPGPLKREAFTLSQTPPHPDSLLPSHMLQHTSETAKTHRQSDKGKPASFRGLWNTYKNWLSQKVNMSLMVSLKRILHIYIYTVGCFELWYLSQLWKPSDSILTKPCWDFPLLDQ